MNRIHIYKIGFFTLIILNVVLLFFLLPKDDFGRKHQEDGERLKEKICQKLNFDDTQRHQFYQLANEHRVEMMAIIGEQKQFVKAYFKLLENDTQEVERQRLSIEIQRLEARKLDVTYQHLTQVKKLCTVAQQEHFAAVVEVITQALLSDGPQKRRKPPRGR